MGPAEPKTGIPRRRKSVLVLITTAEGGKTLQWALTVGELRAVLVGLVALILFALAGIVLSFRLTRLQGVQTRVQAENDSLKMQFGRLDQLEREIARMAQIDDQMRVLAGMEALADTAAVSVSGPDSSHLPANAGDSMTVRPEGTD